jgi:hypothetical protein
LHVACVLGLASLLFAAPALAQIPRDQYLKYVPLVYPRIVTQTQASARFHLYGNPSDPAFHDNAPKDGIDDARGRWLQVLTERFAPLMVRNTPMTPLDFRAFYNQSTFPLTVDGWDIARAVRALKTTENVDLARLADRPCPPGGDPANDDCRLMALINRFGPNRQRLEPEAAASPERELFSVLFIDLPGYNEKTWKENYWHISPTGKQPELAGAERVFAHPFIAETTTATGESGYEFVIQYWFFYPDNDGPNNHEGDWEHINVVVAPRSHVGRPLAASELDRFLSGGDPLDGADPVVIRRVEYYFHHFVYAMDFTSPSVYQPREAWDREVRQMAKARRVSRRLWDRIRERAYRDEAETAINTRPVVWIGGDAVGVQTVLEPPGLRDRDGHASYPFRGYYRMVGGAHEGERALAPFDPEKFFADPGSAPERLEDYSLPGRVALMPDWEALMGPVMTDAGVRRAWSWMLLPVRFGYPTSPSPALGWFNAGLGNLSPVGPTYNDGWNRVGDAAGYAAYDMAEESWAAPLDLADTFFPRAGVLNAPILYFMIKPPLDLIWRTAALPVRAAVGSHEPTFLPANAPLARKVSLEGGPMLTNLGDNLVALFFSREQFPEIVARWAEKLPPGATDLKVTSHFGWVGTPVYSLVFHLSRHFSTESSVIDYRAPVGFDLTSPQLTQPVKTTGTLRQFEYHGTLRFNLTTGSFQPYVAYGHGITWFRLENVAVDGVPLSQPTSPLFRPPGRWSNLGFNETVLGAGADWSGVRFAHTWFGVKANYAWIRNALGLQRAVAIDPLPAVGPILDAAHFTVWRQQARVLVSIGF